MMKDEEAYVLHTPTNSESFAAECMRLQPNMELLNRLLWTFQWNYQLKNHNYVCLWLG